MRKIRIRCPAVFLAALIVLLWHDHTGFLRLALASAVLHESGHVIACRCITRQFPVLTLSLTGISMRPGQQLAPGQLLLLAAAGPLANFLTCIALMLRLKYHASYLGYFFASANLCMGLFNLLPLGPLDGKRMLQALKMEKAGKQ